MTKAPAFTQDFSISLDGDTPPGLMAAVLELSVETSLHLPDVATLRLYDPDLVWVDAASLAPGQPVVVTTGGGSDSITLFDGEVVELEPAFLGDAHQLTVRCFNRLHRLGRGRYVRTFQQMTDSDIITKVVQEAGLSQGTIASTTEVHPYVIQANQTNLDFLRGRAAALGYHLYVTGKNVSCQAPSPSGSVALAWRDSLLEFHPHLSALDQPSSVTVRGWDVEKKLAIVGETEQATGSPVTGISGTGGQVAQQAYGSDAPMLVTSRPVLTQQHAEALAQAVAAHHAGRFVGAEGLAVAQPKLRAGMTVQITGVGTRFSGAYFATTVTHRYLQQAGFTTSFSVSGLNEASFAGFFQQDLTPQVQSGLAIGIVTDNLDPEKMGRVKVKFPWLSEDNATTWIRPVIPGGGNARGIQFLPEVNDEVLVGFELGDIGRPYVLGGLWNGQDAPPKPNADVVAQGKVTVRLIQTRSGHHITFDDTEGSESLTVQSKQLHKVVLDETSVTLTDKNGNKIVLDSTANTLSIDIQGNGSIQTGGNLKLACTGQLDIQGAQVKINGTATVDVQGGLVRLN